MRLFISAAFLLIICAQLSNAQGWRGIIPLYSTRADVEKLLGPSKDECRCTYQADGDWIRVVYSKGPCKGYPAGWNVRADTVLSFTVSWKREREFSDLRLDEDKYEKAYDDAFYTYYSSRNEGVQYTVSSEGRVGGASYIPTDRDAHLRCPCFPLEDDSVFRTPPFDYFSGKTFEDTLARLDNFAIQLTQSPEWKGYVVVYAGKRMSLAMVRKYSQGWKDYLIKRRGIPSDKVVMIDGGYRDDLSVELYLFGGDTPPPKARATFVPCRKQVNKVRRSRGRT